VGNTFYIANGDFAAYILKEAIHEGLPKARILCFREDLSQGPLYDAHSLDLMKKRLDYWKEQSKNLGNIANYIQAGQMSIEEMDIPKSQDVIYIWLGASVFDQLAMMYQSIFYNEKNCIIKIVPLGSKNLNIAVLDSASIKEYLPQAYTLDQPTILDFNQIWEKLFKESSIACFRILEDNSIKTVEVDYYDKNILSRISSEGTTLDLLIASLIQDDQCQITDVIVENRVQKLVDLGILNEKNDLIFRS
jgi:hypothetical protein